MIKSSPRRVKQSLRTIALHLQSRDERLTSHRRTLEALLVGFRRNVSSAITLNDLWRSNKYRIAVLADKHWAASATIGPTNFAATIRDLQQRVSYEQCALSQFAFEQAGLCMLAAQLRSGATSAAIQSTLWALAASAEISHDAYMQLIVPLSTSTLGHEYPLSQDTKEVYRRRVWRRGLPMGQHACVAEEQCYPAFNVEQGDDQCGGFQSRMGSSSSGHGTTALRSRIWLYLAACLLIGIGLLGVFGIQFFLDNPVVFVSAFSLLILAFGVSVPIAEAILGGLVGEAPRLRLDFCGTGLPSECRVVVAMPMILVSESQIDAVMVNAIWNLSTAADTNVALALLTDHRDSDHRGENNGEAGLKSYVQQEVVRLRAAGHKVTLLHRARDQAIDGTWIGWERKRGKLLQLNALILHGESAFQEVTGDANELIGARYVLSLDEDSRLSRDCIQRLAGVLAHPLNQPRWDHDQKCYIGGYGMVAPRFVTRLGSLSRWRLASAFCGPVGSECDPVRSTRNFLFDWIGLTQYPGKGLYDVRHFQHGTSELPEGCVLSHDTIEGALVRCAYEGGSVISEAFPSSPAALLQRIHRWTRGDMQNYVIFWLFARSPLKEALGRTPFGYTVNMQLRSSLASMALSLSLLPWIFDAHDSVRILLTAFALVAVPPFVQTVYRLSKNVGAVSLKIVTVCVGQLLFAIAVRLSGCWTQAWVVGNGMLRAAGAVLVRRNLLEWQSAAVTDAKNHSIWRVPGVVAASAAAIALFAFAVLLGLPLFHSAPLLVWAAYPSLISVIATRRCERRR